MKRSLYNLPQGDLLDVSARFSLNAEFCSGNVEILETQSLFISKSQSAKSEHWPMGKAEILQQVRDAEAKIRALTKSAEEKRKQLQAEGKRKALEIAEKAEAEVNAKNDARMSAARTDIERRKKAQLEEGAKRASALKSAARSKMASAKNYVVSEFERAVDA